MVEWIFVLWIYVANDAQSDVNAEFGQCSIKSFTFDSYQKCNDKREELGKIDIPSKAVRIISKCVSRTTS